MSEKDIAGFDDDDFWFEQRAADAAFMARTAACVDCAEGTCERPWPHIS